MAKSKTGALIVFEGLTKLGDYIETGKPVDARVTSNLLQNIFYGHAPLHDGALVIRDMRILAASCVLPSTKSRMDFGSMGTRHRAAVGVTEVYGMDEPRTLCREGFAFLREHSMTPPELIDELSAGEKRIFSRLYAGSFAKKLYRLYEYEKT